MSVISIGQIRQINRYPVKSFAGESLQVSRIEAYGLYGDRRYAFIDPTKEGWDSFITARAIPEMLSYEAKLIGEDSVREFPDINVISQDGRIFGWNEVLLDEIQRYSKITMTMMTYPHHNSSDLMAVDTGSILLITDTSLRKLEAIWGKSIDTRRFRANLIVSLDDDSLHEGNWLGKRLSVGNVELQIDIYCKRCSMITIDPDTLHKDTLLLKRVNEEMGLNFGVYASVIKTGQVKVGEKVYVVDSE